MILMFQIFGVFLDLVEYLNLKVMIFFVIFGFFIQMNQNAKANLSLKILILKCYYIGENECQNQRHLNFLIVFLLVRVMMIKSFWSKEKLDYLY